MMRGGLVSLPYACEFSETLLSVTFWECIAGVSLNTTINTAVSINPEIVEADTLRAWLVIDTLHLVPLSVYTDNYVGISHLGSNTLCSTID